MAVEDEEREDEEKVAVVVELERRQERKQYGKLLLSRPGGQPSQQVLRPTSPWSSKGAPQRAEALHLGIFFCSQPHSLTHSSFLYFSDRVRRPRLAFRPT